MRTRRFLVAGLVLLASCLTASAQSAASDKALVRDLQKEFRKCLKNTGMSEKVCRQTIQAAALATGFSPKEATALAAAMKK